MGAPEWNYGHISGVTDVAYIGRGEETRLVTCGADSLVTLRHPETQVVEESFSEEHEDAVNAIAVAPDGAKFATGSDDNCVKLFNFAGVTREFESNVVRFTLPVRALAYSADGAYLAAGGDDSVVKVVKMEDRSVAHELVTRSKCIKSIAFDPKGDFLSAVDDTGVLTVWALKSIATEDDAEDDADNDDDKKAGAEPGEMVLSATTAPVIGPDSPAKNGAAWRPDGAVLAVPGRERDVTFFERGSWTELEDHRLMTPETDSDTDEKKGHGDNVVLVAWSPNSKYLLTSGNDAVTAVWDVSAKKVVASITHDAVVCGASWRAEGNAIALVDANGSWCVWKNPVPGSMTSPTAEVAAEELNFFHAKAGTADGVVRTSGKDLDALEGTDNDEDDEALGDMDEEEYYAEMERRRKAKRAAAKVDVTAVTAVTAAPTPQPPFQVGSVPAAGKDAAATVSGSSRRFLCYNMLGTVVSTGEPGGDFNSVEMAFHDTSRAGRIPTMTDYYGYSLGVLGEKGCALASPCKPEGGAATLFFRPYESWAHASEWRVTFPAGEEAAAVATGSSWVAAVTSARMLRVFSLAGAQRQMVSLAGAPVTCCGKGSSLVVAWHAAAPSLMPGGVEQRIEFAEYDVSNGGRVLHTGAVPVPPGHTLTWLGHVEDGSGALAFGASDGVVRVYTPDFGGSWTPVFRSADARAAEGEHHWTVAVSTADSPYASAGHYCIVCRNASGPKVHPKPVLTPLPLSMPVVLPDASSGDLEDAAAKAQLSVSLAAAAVATAGFAGEHGPAGDALRAAQAAADKAALRLFHAACRGERSARAADIAKGLHLPQSMHGALKLANAMSQGVLAERVTNLIEASMAAAVGGDAYGTGYGGEMSQLETPGQAPQTHYSAPAAYVPPAAAPVPAEEANPFARRKSVSTAPVAPAGDAENANVNGSQLAGTKVKAGYETNAPPAKKGRVANPFARR